MTSIKLINVLRGNYIPSILWPPGSTHIQIPIHRRSSYAVLSWFLNWSVAMQCQ